MKILRLVILLLILTAVCSQAQNDPKMYLNRYLQKTAVDDSLSNYGLTWSAISLTTGTFTNLVPTSVSAFTITGSVTATDSTTSIIMAASDGTLWRLKVKTDGTITADSTGLN